MNSGKIFFRYSPRFQRIIVIVDCHIQCYNDVIRLLTVVFLQLWGLSSLKRWQEGMVGVPKLVFKFFYREIHFSELVKQRKKTVAFVFFSQCYSGKFNIFYIYYFSANFARSVARGTTSIQPSFSLHHPTLCWTHRYRTLYYCLWPTFVTIAIWKHVSAEKVPQWAHKRTDSGCQQRP